MKDNDLRKEIAATSEWYRLKDAKDATEEEAKRRRGARWACATKIAAWLINGITRAGAAAAVMMAVVGLWGYFVS